ncbi:hypothetical protein [Leptothermofonsia sp. ETS-13]|uniref:hypothetical protein n=1 Tax=Leptothermofonsia sp. ETS-13 TaxID=3035696 RepID=UPI003B9F9CBF
MTSAFRITAFIPLLTLGGFTMLDDIRALTGGAQCTGSNTIVVVWENLTGSSAPIFPDSYPHV